MADTSPSVLDRLLYDPVHSKLKYPSPPPKKKIVKGSNKCSKNFQSKRSVEDTQLLLSRDWMKSRASNHQIFCPEEKKFSLLERGLLSGKESAVLASCLVVGDKLPCWLFPMTVLSPTYSSLRTHSYFDICSENSGFKIGVLFRYVIPRIFMGLCLFASGQFHMSVTTSKGFS